MGKKSKRQRPSKHAGSSRREVIKARHQNVLNPGKNTINPGKPYDDVEWNDLEPTVLAAAQLLGYDEDRWNKDYPPRLITDNPNGSPRWNQLTQDQQEAAQTLGYSESTWWYIRRNYDNFSVQIDEPDEETNAPVAAVEEEPVEEEDPFDEEEGTEAPLVEWELYGWDELPPLVQQAYGVFGYDQNKWDNGIATETVDMYWAELTGEQRQAAIFLGYNPRSGFIQGLGADIEGIRVGIDGIVPHMNSTCARERADLMKKRFLDTSADESRVRVALMIEYHEVIYDTMGLDNYHAVRFVTKEDKKFLKSVTENSSELVSIRAIATDLWRKVSSKRRETEEMYHCLHRVIQLCQHASEMEKQINLTDGSSVGDRLTEIIQTAQADLDEARARRTAIPVYGETGRYAPIVGSDQCLVCDTTYQDLGVVMLKCCQRCQLTYYCSPECQRKDWKDHKKVCRKPGEFQIGDLAWSIDPSAAIFQQFVLILGPAPDESDKSNPQSWVAVVVEEQKRRWIVHSTDLTRCRPVMWKDTDVIVEAMGTFCALEPAGENEVVHVLADQA